MKNVQNFLIHSPPDRNPSKTIEAFSTVSVTTANPISFACRMLSRALPSDVSGVTSCARGCHLNLASHRESHVRTVRESCGEAVELGGVMSCGVGAHEAAAGKRPRKRSGRVREPVADYLPQRLVEPLPFALKTETDFDVESKGGDRVDSNVLYLFRARVQSFHVFWARQTMFS